jgi:hypothetical protein
VNGVLAPDTVAILLGGLACGVALGSAACWWQRERIMGWLEKRIGR